MNKFIIPYKLSGSVIYLANEYSNIFIYTQQTDCLIDSCRLLKDDSLTPYTGKEIIIGQSPKYPISATESIPEGYKTEFVYNCIIKPTGLALIDTFKMKINVV